MKQEALEVLKNRRAIRAFKPDQITEEELNTVLEAGTFAPTGGGTQGVQIVAVQTPENVAAVDVLNAKVLDNPKAHPYYGAPTIILVAGRRRGMHQHAERSLCCRPRLLLDPPLQADVRTARGQGAAEEVGAAGDTDRRGVHRTGLRRLRASCREAEEGGLYPESINGASETPVPAYAQARPADKVPAL